MSTLSRDEHLGPARPDAPASRARGAALRRAREPAAARAARRRGRRGARLDRSSFRRSQGPDEISHFAYTERIVETRSIPYYPGSSRPTRPLDVDRDATRPRSTAGSSPSRATRSRARPDRSCRSSCGGASRRAPTTPTAPTAATRRRWAARRCTTCTRRCPTSRPTRWTSSTASSRCALANIPLLLALVALTWAIAGHAAAAPVAAGPRHRGGRAQPAAHAPRGGGQPRPVPRDDLGGVLLPGDPRASSAARRGAGWPGIAALTVASCLTHGRGIALVVPAALVLDVRVVAMAAAEPARRRRRSLIAAAGVVVAAPPTWRCATRRSGRRRPDSARQFVSYLWQFYLPKLSFMAPSFRPDWTVRDAFIDRFYGTFAQLEVYFSPGVMTLLAHLTVAAVVLALVGLVVRLRSVRARSTALWVLARLRRRGGRLPHGHARRGLPLAGRRRRRSGRDGPLPAAR